MSIIRRSQWPRGLRRGPTAVCLLGLRVRIPPRAWMSVCCECCVLSGRGLCDGLITRPEESYRVWCVQLSVIVKPRKMRRPRPPRGCSAIEKNNSTHSFLTSKLDGLDWSTSLSGRCNSSKGFRYPLERRLIGPKSWPRRFKGEINLLSLSGFVPRTVQPVAWSLHRLCQCL
jgi:hypothetical protein